MIRTLVLLAYFVCLQSCDKPTCNNENPILEKHDFDSYEYKSELTRLIQDQNNTSYWVNSYYENIEGKFIVVDIVGNNICAKATIKIVNDNGLEDIIRTKGKGYIGAELEDLKFDIDKSSSITFTYKSISGIFD